MPSSEAVRVLLVDDDEDDFVMTRALLAEVTGSIRFRLEWAPTYDQGRALILEGRHDVYLLDYQLGGRDGLELLQEAIAAGCKAPIILLTGQGDDAVDRDAMKAGAADFLVKGQADAHLLERSIRYALERRRIEQMKDRLLALASHELRTPLTAIKGYALTILQGGALAPDALETECLQSIIQGADHLTRLIDGFLDLSRVEAGRAIDLVREDFDVRAMVDEAVGIAAMAARRCTYVVACDEGIGALHGDRYKLLLVLTNLLSNADKYSPGGGEVTLRVTRAPGEVRFAVEDHGMGIPADAHDALFTPFHRVRDPRALDIRGTGLGLSLSKHLVEAHGGRIWIDSEVGRGTTVSFTIPARTSPAPQSA